MNKNKNQKLYAMTIKMLTMAGEPADGEEGNRQLTQFLDGTTTFLARFFKTEQHLHKLCAESIKKLSKDDKCEV